MPIDRSKSQRRRKPWMAQRRRDGVDYCLGYYATRREAERVEMQFDLEEARRVVRQLERLLGGAGTNESVA